MKKSVCELALKNNKTFIKDYRLRSDIEIVKGNLKQLKRVILKSKYIGVVIGQVPRDHFNNYVIVQYRSGFALGELN
ncbi:hypothetical protein [Staphylococcus agnetis]|uniref:Uncharacterized protein n=1 Tax=Staphylococcus agnetis TaxID=985762 RepID=A0ABX3Z0R9_9STAP|nr:hypothetical protein [Staphylococcus agnetis]OSP22609.1 hypothetical protein B9L42_00585 [Staphylococcus agnetis]OSP23100.1 hypothetical protein B9M87_09210 [Staphylococcus agnetis]OTW30497.1 hypothetical protein B9M88_09520 [Staphylococcus agnetis]